jgi:DNA polymerase-1
MGSKVAGSSRADLVVDTELASATGLGLVLSSPGDKTDIMSVSPSALVVASEGGTQSTEWGNLGSIRAWLEDASHPKIVYDSKLLTGVLLREGIVLRGVVFDVLLAAYLLNSGRSAYRLNELVQEQIGLSVAADDWTHLAQALRSLEPVLRRRLAFDGLDRLHDALELPLSPIIARMEMQGVSIDPVWMRQLSDRFGSALATLESDIYGLVGGEKFAIGSPKQLQAVLFEKLGLPTGKRTKTGYSTDSEVLENLAGLGHEIAGKILQGRELTKLKSQYADNLPTLINPSDGKIHTTLSQTVATTGRLSSSNPNLQNIPIRTEIGREIRRGFVASPGNVLLAADYSQIELRIFAHITRDSELLRTFATDEDIHRRTAALVFGTEETQVTSDQRRRAKTINFAVIYGMGDFRLATELGVDRSVAAEWKKRYFANYPGVRRYATEVVAEARVKGYVTTLSGRRRYIPDINSRVAQFRQAAEREAVNMPVQGTSADVIKLAMIAVDKAISESGLVASMILQVHDELLFECASSDIPELARIVRTQMEGAYPLDEVPLKVEVRYGANWADMKPVEGS